MYVVLVAGVSRTRAIHSPPPVLVSQNPSCPLVSQTHRPNIVPFMIMDSLSPVLHSGAATPHYSEFLLRTLCNEIHTYPAPLRVSALHQVLT